MLYRCITFIVVMLPYANAKKVYDSPLFIRIGFETYEHFARFICP